MKFICYRTGEWVNFVQACKQNSCCLNFCLKECCVVFGLKDSSEGCSYTEGKKNRRKKIEVEKNWNFNILSSLLYFKIDLKEGCFSYGFTDKIRKLSFFSSQLLLLYKRASDFATLVSV